MDVVKDIKIAFILGTAIMLFLVFGLLFLVLFYQNHFMKMKRNEANLLLKTALESEKNERERIAIDLHDGVQGDLNALKFNLYLNRRNFCGKVAMNFNIIYPQLLSASCAALSAVFSLSIISSRLPSITSFKL